MVQSYPIIAYPGYGTCYYLSTKRRPLKGAALCFARCVSTYQVTYIADKQFYCYGKKDYSEEFAQHIYQPGTENLLDAVNGFEYKEYENHVQEQGYHNVDGGIFGLQ